jgi:hypothetical protein
MASWRAHLRGFLVARFSTKDALGLFVADYFADIVPELNNDTLVKMADSCISVLMARGRIVELWPPLLVEREQFAEDIARLKAGFIAQAADDAAGSPPQGPELDPFDTCCLVGSNLLLNRKGLRSALRSLARPGGKRILVVRDGQIASSPGIFRTKAGKSHTVHVVSYLRELMGGFETIAIDLEELAEVVPGGPGSQIQPIDLANDIVERMRLDQATIPDPPNNSQWARWVHTFGNLFESALRIDGRNWWILIDGFNTILIPQQTLDLVKRIAKITSLSLDRVRLVLLGYTDSFPLDAVGPYVETEELQLGPRVDEATNDLTHFFARACKERQIGLTAERAADLVAEVLAGALPGLDDKPIPYYALIPRVQACLARLQGD